MAAPDFSLAGRTVLVTGAAGGLGRALADGLEGLGARVVGSSRDPSTAAQLADRYGTPLCLLDLRDVPSFDNRFAIPEALRELIESGRIGCKAGAGFRDYTIEQLDRLVDSRDGSYRRILKAAAT